MTRSHIQLAPAACGSARAQCSDFNPEPNHYVGDVHVVRPTIGEYALTHRRVWQFAGPTL